MVVEGVVVGVVELPWLTGREETRKKRKSKRKQARERKSGGGEGEGQYSEPTPYHTPW